MIRKLWRDERGHILSGTRPPVGDARPPIRVAHLRKDAWWLEPALVVLVLGSFIVYSTWAALQNAHYYAEPYLSPFYAPCLYASCLHPTFGTGVPDIHLPLIGILSPAFLILWGPGLFRLTCYYYRKAYYRAFFWDPPACSVGEPHRKYTGETRFPFSLQNMHRFALYLALFWLIFLWYDVYEAFHFEDGFGIGLGSLFILLSTGTLTLYTTSCHSWRHIVGGKLDCFSCSASARARHGIWQRVTGLNMHHQLHAWISLFSVAAADVYVRLLSMGVIRDVRFL